MKHILLTSLFASAILISSAEPEILKITYNNGSTKQIDVADIKEMTFEQKESIVPEHGDLLDIVFNADGTATDVSPFHHTVITKPGSALMTYYSDIHNCYVANFRNPMGAVVTDSYYRINYTKNGDFINRIADGCTFETIIKLNEPNPGTAEVKWFSSMQAGGIGFLLPIHRNGAPGTRCMTFLPNCSPDGTSNYRWTYSDVEPVPGVYYHVVGVWNKDLERSYIYVNGQLSGWTSAPGVYVPVAAGAESFIIGGDPDTGQVYCAAAWNGEVATVRIYDDPYTAEQVAQLWENAKFDQSASAILLSNVAYLPTCEISTGYKYTIYADGFNTGDTIELVKTPEGKAYKAATTIADGSATITIPDGMTSGDYNVILRRGNSQSPISIVNFTICDSPAEIVAPKTIAHRGAHTNGRTENSIAALEAAMDLNYYGIELDTWITTDGQVVVHHDGQANGLTFQSCTYDQIKNITLANGEKLPTFDSFINSFVKKRETSTSKLIIEIKSHWTLDRCKACVDAVIKLINDNNLKDRVEFIAFNYDVCKYIHQIDPDYNIGYLYGDKEPRECFNDGINSIDYSYAAFGSHPEFIKQARDLGMIVNVWTINTSTEMLKYWGQGVHYITTDAPATLEELKSRTYVSK